MVHRNVKIKPMWELHFGFYVDPRIFVFIIKIENTKGKKI